ncbi:hypothetical protein RRG08_029681 [Elysia crispata]|uniref:Uncharacterized protein n=1 Tax=Elysia crispata TaxID=231223 RepID=A0AAE1BCG3_9GAST|nr:hypothetical protein RRG08_029681 [Elysia crispata]
MRKVLPVSQSNGATNTFAVGLTSRFTPWRNSPSMEQFKFAQIMWSDEDSRGQQTWRTVQTYPEVRVLTRSGMFQTLGSPGPVSAGLTEKSPDRWTSNIAQVSASCDSASGSSHGELLVSKRARLVSRSQALRRNYKHRQTVAGTHTGDSFHFTR